MLRVSIKHWAVHARLFQGFPHKATLLENLIIQHMQSMQDFLAVILQDYQVFILQEYQVLIFSVHYNGVLEDYGVLLCLPLLLNFKEIKQ